MWASRWKITIGRPRKTSSQSGYFFVFRDENRDGGGGGGGRRPIVAGLSRARIARTGHLFGGEGRGREGKITESHCGLYYLVAAYHLSGFIFLYATVASGRILLYTL